MFSVSPTEVLTIAVVALLVFGPKRLPEIARKAGKLLSEIRGAASDLKAGLEAEYEETIEPLKDVRDTMRDAIAGADGSRRMTGAVIPSTPAEEPDPGATPSQPDAAEDEAESES